VGMGNKNFEILIHGFDTIQCAYFMECNRGKGIDFQLLWEKKEKIRASKSKDPLLITLGKCNFLLHPFGTASGYPLVISNEDFRIEMGEFNNPNFFVTFRSQGLWLNLRLICTINLSIGRIAWGFNLPDPKAYPELITVLITICLK
jgi:hypothetical protein